MSIFKRAQTTKNIEIGIPEAESEANYRARVKLGDVFEDYLGILPELETEKFIVIGKKGSGKSAIGQILFEQSKSTPNKFCEFIRKSDIDLEEIVQISAEKGFIIQKEILFKWVILIRLIKMITENESLQHLKEIKMLREFLKKNTGFVKIDKYELKEIIKSNGFEIFIEKLKHFFTFRLHEDIKITGEKAPFYKLIPHLESVVITMLKNDTVNYNDNKYTIIFDDLDIDFKAGNEENVETLLNLIRIAKDYNNNLFGVNKIDAKVIILLRDDISTELIKKSADMAKIFSSYSISLKWFEHDLYKRDENLTKIKQFINRRIKHAFNKNGIKYEMDEWNSLIKEDPFYKETSFKYVIDHTFQTPRDLILFFQDLSKLEYQIPLTNTDINSLIGKYSSKCKGEITNALAIYFTANEIENIFKVLLNIVKFEEFDYSILKSELSKFTFVIECDKIAEILYEYSLIGNKNPNSSMVYFKYRESNDEQCNINYESNFILHRILKVYFSNIRQ